MSYLAAVVQLSTSDNPGESLNRALEGIDRAADLGAQLIALPENVHYIGTEADKRRHAEPLDGPTFSALADKARARQVYLLAGSLPEQSEDPARPYNTSVLYGPDGARRAVYRKIHLFDVALGEGATHTESAATSAGEEAVVVETPLGRWGLTICYDLRFPDLYRALRRADVDLIFVPSAFTIPTGRDHWMPLLRARAIENQCFIVAPAQVGHNGPTRRTYGRSTIIDPWGTVLSTCADAPSVAVAPIDRDRALELRRRLPCLDHERTFRVVVE